MAKGKKGSGASKAKKRKVRIEPEGMAFISASFNNVIVTMTNRTGDVISWSSAGKSGFRGSKKNTPYAAQVSANDAAKVAFDSGLRTVVVYVKGPGSGREAAIRAIDQAGVRVSRIQDTTPAPHNGCRPPKRRRV